ncbi:hypothetical protein PCE1_003852 [Barthelona sp. PCE]
MQEVLGEARLQTSSEIAREEYLRIFHTRLRAPTRDIVLMTQSLCHIDFAPEVIDSLIAFLSDSKVVMGPRLAAFYLIDALAGSYVFRTAMEPKLLQVLSLVQKKQNYKHVQKLLTSWGTRKVFSDQIVQTLQVSSDSIAKKHGYYIGTNMMPISAPQSQIESTSSARVDDTHHMKNSNTSKFLERFSGILSIRRSAIKCPQCGISLINSEAREAHIKSHSTSRYMRGFNLSQQTWEELRVINGIEHLNIEIVNETFEEQKQDEEIEIKYEEQLSKIPVMDGVFCASCGEEFDTAMNNGRFVFVNCYSVGGRFYHHECLPVDEIPAKKQQKVN